MNTRNMLTKMLYILYLRVAYLWDQNAFFRFFFCTVHPSPESFLDSVIQYLVVIFNCLVFMSTFILARGKEHLF